MAEEVDVAEEEEEEEEEVVVVVVVVEPEAEEGVGGDGTSVLRMALARPDEWINVTEVGSLLITSATSVPARASTPPSYAS